MLRDRMKRAGLLWAGLAIALLGIAPAVLASVPKVVFFEEIGATW